MNLKSMLLGAVAAVMSTAAMAEDLKMAVTTSFANSGLAEVLLPKVAEDTGINVQLLIVGTGQALALGEAGDVDAVLVHS
ncbi:MAG: substrate-binding domain-containing protein, partial [Pseudomonadota bacterium]|nr:substrate-binding domain-containing protein [Pseudomonadota bacterium]